MSRRAAAPTESDATPVNPLVPTLGPVSMTRHIATVPIDDVGPSPLQPRQHVVEADRTELMQSIKVHGIIEPLVVRERPIDQLADGKYRSRLELVAGEQRWTTAKRAGVTEVDVVIRELTDAHVIEFGLVENLRRTDLHPMDEAAAYERLIAMNPAYTDDALADRVGKDVSTIRKRRKLLRLIPDCRAAFLFGAITVKHAEKLSTVTADQQPTALKHCFSDLLVWEGDDEVTAAWDVHVSADDHDKNVSAVDVLILAGLWGKLAMAQKSVGDLDEWIGQHVRADVTDREVQAQLGLELPPTPEWMDPTDAAAADEHTHEEIIATLLQLSESYDWSFKVKDAKAAGVVHPSLWHEITSKKDACEHAQRGAVVHGGPLRLVDQVCVAKKCGTHRPEPVKADRTTADPKTVERQKKEQEKTEATRKAWEDLRPQLMRAFAVHVAKIKVTPDLLEACLGDWRVEEVCADFGIKLSPDTVGQVMACAVVGDSHFFDAPSFDKLVKVFGFSSSKVKATAPEPETKKSPATPAAKPAASKKAAPKVAKKKPAAAKQGAARKAKKR